MLTTQELVENYGNSEKDTGVLGLGRWKLGEDILFKDGKQRRLIHIEYRNIAIDLLRFDDGTELFTGDIKNNFDFKTNLKDFRGNIISIGDDLIAKWGGVGTVLIEEGNLIIAFESGNIKTKLDEQNISYRELARCSK